MGKKRKKSFDRLDNPNDGSRKRGIQEHRPEHKYYRPEEKVIIMELIKAEEEE